MTRIHRLFLRIAWRKNTSIDLEGCSEMEFLRVYVLNRFEMNEKKDFCGCNIAIAVLTFTALQQRLNN